MADSKAVSIRIPDELLAKIDDLAERNYKSIKGKPNRSLVILDALVSHFDKLPDTENSSNAVTLNDTVTVQDFQKLQNLVNIMIGEIEELKKTVTTVSDSADETNVINVEQKNSDQLELIQIIESTVSEDVVNFLTGKQLSDRLKCDPSTLSGQKGTYEKNPQKFIDWSKSKDPDGYGWEPREGQKKSDLRYLRVEEEACLSEG